MGLTRRDALGFAAGLAAAGALPARAQSDWPNARSASWSAPRPAAAPTSSAGCSPTSWPRLGQSITVENNTGGGGGIAASMVTNAPPDGTR